MNHTPPIEFDKQDPGHSMSTPLTWEILSKKNKNYIISRRRMNPISKISYTKYATQPIPMKKLRPYEPVVDASHGNCYGRGYVALLGRAVVSSRTVDFK